ncbi:hypothetical protein [Azospirillum palustre]
MRPAPRKVRPLWAFLPVLFVSAGCKPLPRSQGLFRSTLLGRSTIPQCG